MKILIKGTKLDLTPPLKEYIELKFRGLEKFLKRFDDKGSAMLRIEIARSSRHHKKGEVYYAEANLDIPHGTIRAECYHSDARLAISEAKKILEGEIKKHKSKWDAKR